MSTKAQPTQGKVVPLCLVEKTASYDTLSTLQRLEEITQSGDCVSIAFGAILRGGKIAHGYTGAAVEQPTLAAGILSKVIFSIHKDAKSGW
ncbi:hypothetical protein [Nitrosococcus wardiae]|uniref:Uncharacterized protein n=1 Tax=Nitrosococcus wardiae TaxID=1814290 RepID=A0A4P7BVS5_9GAMM|nr:hypothetical protein [Nitrosococcus wardiae]QBQ53377.1 hypothetical protein E3U44_01790 [Nitrosococcus wardiae]